MFTMPFILFVIAMTGTPGPGNLTLMAIGQATGFRSALPFLAGTTSGFFCLNLAVGFGLGELFVASPALNAVMKVLGTAYILYLAWKVVRLNIDAPEMARQFLFRDGALIHPFSPKSWAMSVVGFSQFSDPAAPLLPQVVAFVCIFFVFQLSFHCLWCAAGVWLVRLLRSVRIRVAVNCTVALLMVGATMHALLL
ncbi:LysE family translocator [Salidesulfovibrio onnuriiensis]|uniref:LysE family translocator n=1 Tax=Salidesulfovibrio onnuriiensis TaxID=2583823 RepID=UPI0011CB2DDA|nr:LysE family translocator [Salidesulfovibrio onnuriiensis]